MAGELTLLTHPGTSAPLREFLLRPLTAVQQQVDLTPGARTLCRNNFYNPGFELRSSAVDSTRWWIRSRWNSASPTFTNPP